MLFRSPICGDGIYLGVAGEECDDGNILDSNTQDQFGNPLNRAGDGCSSTCKVENGWWCIAPYIGGRSECYCSPNPISNLNVFSDEVTYMEISYKFNK